MDKSKNRTDLLAAGRKKLQQFRQKKDHKGGGSHAKSLNKASKPGKDADADELTKVTEPEAADGKVVYTHESVTVSEPLPTSGIEADDTAKMPEPDSSLADDADEPTKVPEPEPTSAIDADDLVKGLEPELESTSVVDAEARIADPSDPLVAVRYVDLLPLPSVGGRDVGVQKDQVDSEEVPVDVHIDDGGSRSAVMVHHQVGAMQKAKNSGLEQCNGENSGIGMLMVKDRRDQAGGSTVFVAPDTDRSKEDTAAAEPSLGVEAGQEVDRLSAPTEEIIEGEDGLTKSSGSLEMRFLGIQNGKEDYDAEKYGVKEETVALESLLLGRPQEANGVSIPVDTIQEMGTKICDELLKIPNREESLEMLSQLTSDRSSSLEENADMPSPSHVTSGATREESSAIADARGEVSINEESCIHQPYIGEVVGAESESARVLQEGVVAPAEKVEGFKEDDPFFLSKLTDPVPSTGMWYMLKRVLQEGSFANELDSIRRHLYLTIVARDFLQMQLDEQTVLTADFHQQFSDEVSKLLGLVKEAQEGKAMANEELAQCRSDLQAMTIAKEELEIRFISTSGEIECLNNRASELQNKLEQSQKELVLVSADLANFRGLVEALQKKNMNLTESISSEMDARKILEEEKELLSSENMRLASELSEQKERLLVALDKQKQLECNLRETGAFFDYLTEENIYLSSSLDLHKAKIKELDVGHIKLLFQAQQARDQENNCHVECRATDNAVEDSGSSMKNSVGLQQVDEEGSGSSVALGLLKGHLEEAKSILQNLEKSIQGMHSYSVSLSRAGGRAPAPGVSKLIQAFESKTHHADNASDKVPLTEGGQSDDLYTLAMEQMGLFRDTLKQMELDVRKAEAHVIGEYNSREIFQKYEIECEAQRQQNSVLQAKIDEIVKKLSKYISRIDDLQHQFNEIQQCASDEEGRLLNEVKLLQEEVNDRVSSLQHETDSIKGIFKALEKIFPSTGLQTSDLVTDKRERLLSEIQSLQKDVIDRNSIKVMIFEALEKLNSSTGLLFADNIEIGSYVSASVDAAIRSIESLHEKLNAARLNHETLHTSYMELDKLYNDVRGMNGLAIRQMHKMYDSLQKLCPSVDESEMDVNAEEVLELLPKRHELLIEYLQKLLDEQVLYLSKTKELESGLLSKNEEIEGLSKRCSALDKKLDDLCYAKDELEMILMSKNEVLDEVNGRCLALAKKLDGHEPTKDPNTFHGLAEINKVIARSDNKENDLSKSVLQQLEVLFDFHLQKYEEAIKQINLSKKYLKEVNIIPEISSDNWSLPLLTLLSQEFMPTLHELQEKLDSLSALNFQQETENQILKESLRKMEEGLGTSRSELYLKVSELEQSEQRLSSVREKLSIAVAKGKGLIVQRDSLKQSLMEKASELEKCSQELQAKEELLMEVEAKLKSYSEADRIKALESELSYIRNSTTALRDSFLFKDSVLQRIEEVLEDLDLPEHFHSKDIVEKIEFLSRMVAGSITEWDQRSSAGGSHSIADTGKDDLQASSNPGYDELENKYEELQRKFYGLAEHNDMLEQSLMERNSLVQKWEEALDRIDMPLQFRTLEPEDKIEWLGNALFEVQHERDALHLKIENLEDSSDMLIVDLEESHKKISELSAEVVAIKSEKDFFSESLEKLRFEYLGLSEKAVHDEIERDNLRKELASLQEKSARKIENRDYHDTENDVRKLVDLVSNAFPDSDRSEALSAGTVTECLEGLLRKLIDKYADRALEKSMHKVSEKEFVLEESNLSPDANTSTNALDGKDQELVNLRLELDEACCNLVSVKKERDEAMEKCHSVMLEVEEIGKQINLLQEEKTVYMEKYQSLLLELDAISKQRDALQEQLTQEEQKSASVREKLNVAVRKGKALVQQRDSLKQAVEEMSVVMDNLKTEHIQRVEALESEKSLLMNQLTEMEQSLQDHSKTFNRFLTALHGIDVGCEINVTDPVQKMEEIGRLSRDLRSALVSSENEAKKSKQASELLLAELNEVQERADVLMEELAKAEATITECSRQKEIAEAARIDARNRLEQLILVNSEERKKQIGNLLELKSGIGQLRNVCFEFSGLLANVFTRDMNLFCSLENFMESIEKQMNCANLADLPVLSSSSLLSSNPVNEVESLIGERDGKVHGVGGGNEEDDEVQRSEITFSGTILILEIGSIFCSTFFNSINGLLSQGKFHAINALSDPRMQEQLDDSSIAEHLAITGHSVFECLRQCDELKRNIHKHSLSVDQQATLLLQIMETVQRKLASQREGSDSLKRDLNELELVIKEKDNQICSMSRNLSLLYEACSSSISEIENGKAQIVENSLPSGEHSLEKTGTVLKLPSYTNNQEHPDGYTYSFTDDCIRSMADKLLSAVKGTSIVNEMAGGTRRELKATILDLQREIQEKDIQMNRICEELVSQIRDAEAATRRSSSDLDSAKTKIHNLEKQVEVLEKDNKLLELRVHEVKDLEDSLHELQGKIKSLTDALTAKDQEIEALMQALDEEETQMEDVERKNKELENIIQEKNLALESLEASRAKVAAKLSMTVSKFDELHNLSESLLAEVENLQSQLRGQDSEISFLRQEITRYTNDLLASQETNKKYSSEICKLLKWFDTVVAHFGVQPIDIDDQEFRQIQIYTDILDKKILSVMTELDDLRVTVKSKDALLQIERARVEELSCKSEVLDNSLHEKGTQMELLQRNSSQASSMNSPRSLEIEQMKNKVSSGAVVTHVRSGRKVNNDQIAIAIDTENDNNMLVDEDDDKVHTITFLNEGLVSFNQKRLSLEEKLKASKKARRAAEDVKGATKEEVSQARSELQAAREKVRALEGLVAIEHGAARVLLKKVAELEEALKLGKAVVKAVEDRVVLIRAKVEEEKAKAIIEAKLKGIEEFKASIEFENEVTEGSSVAYIYDFEAYKRCLGWMVLKLNLSCLRPKDSNNEGETFSLDEDEPAPTSTKDEHALTENPIPGPTAKDAVGGLIEETVNHAAKPSLKDLD
ncbi:centromere-associated protein E [Cocos nucifera]|uniref:Centromere-associated protein E n=1 Tax=Cocos nucifera TaxID=13894 RepID=A0A8K0I1Z5_COCNU|nr:centromere-associated protein E [Cocos nucifera]